MSPSVREVSKVRVAREQLVGKLLGALDDYEADKIAFARYNNPALYMRRGLTLTDAKHLAETDPRTLRAAGLGEWHQGDVTAYATALIAFNTLPEEYE